MLINQGVVVILEQLGVVTMVTGMDMPDSTNCAGISTEVPAQGRPVDTPIAVLSLTVSVRTLHWSTVKLQSMQKIRGAPFIANA
jgi:hypothetical protein